jgi:hypothetical protein
MSEITFSAGRNLLGERSDDFARHKSRFFKAPSGAILIRIIALDSEPSDKHTAIQLSNDWVAHQVATNCDNI